MRCLKLLIMGYISMITINSKYSVLEADSRGDQLAFLMTHFRTDSEISPMFSYNVINYVVHDNPHPVLCGLRGPHSDAEIKAILHLTL